MALSVVVIHACIMKWHMTDDFVIDCCEIGLLISGFQWHDGVSIQLVSTVEVRLPSSSPLHLANKTASVPTVAKRRPSTANSFPAIHYENSAPWGITRSIATWTWQPSNDKLISGFRQIDSFLFFLQISMPKNQVLFECNMQMNEHDVKNYLEQIYDVPVHHVRLTLHKGEQRIHAKGMHAQCAEWALGQEIITFQLSWKIPLASVHGRNAFKF